MVSLTNGNNERPAWFVGAHYSGYYDQTERFLIQGIWENGYDDRYLDRVNAVLPGDRIAIKRAYPRNSGIFPFDNRGYSVPEMVITAIGIVTENLGNGRHLRVDWTPVEPPRVWYFSYYRPTISRVYPGRWDRDALISFTFENQAQDIDRFRNDPRWRDRFGDRS